MNRSVSSQVRDFDLVSQRREAIVQAAIRVFRSEGFHSATTRMIAREAKVTQSNIYNYVRTKGDILYLVCEHLVGLYDDGVAEVLEAHADPHTRLIEALRAVLRIMMRHKDELVLLYNETHALDKPDRRQILKSVSRLNLTFQRLLADYEAEAGPVIVANRRVAANLLTFVPAIVALRWWDLSLHAEKGEIEELIFDFILNGLGIAQAGR